MDTTQGESAFSYPGRPSVGRHLFPYSSGRTAGIHPVEPRGISVREAARLQSFPDAYLFQSNMGNSYRQIGNAVLPLLSLAIAKAIKKTLNEKKHKGLQSTD
ncbi:MAG: DNA cytosine methyltransferase [Allobaculum sp.]|uniref:DNA cytosine methyltransferase n=1 Tax=Allobaculum sp. TaxID=1872463 RepID=UPI00399AE794